MTKLTLMTEKWDSTSQICALVQFTVQNESYLGVSLWQYGILGPELPSQVVRTLLLADIKGTLGGEAMESG